MKQGIVRRWGVLGVSAVLASGCASAPASLAETTSEGASAVTLRSDITPVTRMEDAKPGVAIPSFMDCRPPLPGATGRGPSGNVCTRIAVGGSTEEGKHFADYGDCAIVRTQRPYYPSPLAGTSRPDDPRLKDERFMAELAWVTEQTKASACTCCHDAPRTPKGAAKWDISAGPLWIDTASDRALALFSGLMDSSVFGSYPPDQNNGFQRTETGIPSTDPKRMRAFFVAELQRRGVTEEQARAYPPFGPPQGKAQEAPTCDAGTGVTRDGRILWNGSLKGRYISLLRPTVRMTSISGPPVVGPEVLFRLEVLASSDPLESGLVYGSTPPGTFQAFPETGSAPTLVEDSTYTLFVGRDIGRSGVYCKFTYPTKAPSL